MDTVGSRRPDARAILAAGLDTAEDELGELVSARIERQAIFDRATQPKLWAVLNEEAVLHRLVGSRKVMYDQLLHLADTSCHPRITVQIVPAGQLRRELRRGGRQPAGYRRRP